jgi:hypothetical protein
MLPHQSSFLRRQKGQPASRTVDLPPECPVRLVTLPTGQHRLFVQYPAPLQAPWLRAGERTQNRGATNICSIFARYNYIFEPDDAHLAEVERTCKSGERLCGDCKTELWGKVRTWLKAHHAAREKAKDHIEEFVVRDYPWRNSLHACLDRTPFPL